MTLIGAERFSAMQIKEKFDEFREALASDRTESETAIILGVMP